MKALTVRQPYGFALFHGKNVENRRQMFTHRGLLLIHTGQHLAPASAFEFVNHLADAPLPVLGQPGEPTECALGSIIGAVQVIGAHRVDACGGTCSPWAERDAPAHLRIGQPRVFRLPIPAFGRLGIWEILDPQVEAAVQRELDR
jgi:hypothetical protein